MKTPHYIDLYYASDKPTYDPVFDTFTNPEVESLRKPCLVNFMSQKKVYENYGSRSERIIIVRFAQSVSAFDYAYFKGDRYEAIERVDIPAKHAVHLKFVGE